MKKKCFLLTADVLPPHEDPWPTAGAQFQPYPAPAPEYSPAHFDRVDHPLSEVSQLQCHENAQTLLRVTFPFLIPVLSGELRRPCAQD